MIPTLACALRPAISGLSASRAGWIRMGTGWIRMGTSWASQKSHGASRMDARQEEIEALARLVGQTIKQQEESINPAVRTKQQVREAATMIGGLMVVLGGFVAFHAISDTPSKWRERQQMRNMKLKERMNSASKPGPSSPPE